MNDLRQMRVLPRKEEPKKTSKTALTLDTGHQSRKLLSKNFGEKGPALMFPYIIRTRNSRTVLKCQNCGLSMGKDGT